MASSGLGNSTAFMASGWPFITGSIITASSGYAKVELPTVAKSITIKNVDASEIYPFNLTGSCPLLVFFGVDLTGTYPPPQVTKNHFISIPVSGTVTLPVKATQFFIGKKTVSEFGAFQVSVERTSIPDSDMYAQLVRNSLTQSVKDGIYSNSVGIES